MSQTLFAFKNFKKLQDLKYGQTLEIHTDMR